ncbi:hypothetical protein HMPREF9193_00899 [Treponema lecithinolyticum ATCC 700332]|uniref:Uncharacterized protein n=1 Tax=Treponema lecithinolyticum ATCC 700332 TaxID=1321815 RepID=A0ABN0NZF9_TRELE|nr:hypothetical protein HMPREF9193_00899 [Treponema lecithinolyticum ATCC 700332]
MLQSADSMHGTPAYVLADARDAVCTPYSCVDFFLPFCYHIQVVA